MCVLSFLFNFSLFVWINFSFYINMRYFNVIHLTLSQVKVDTLHNCMLCISYVSFYVRIILSCFFSDIHFYVVAVFTSFFFFISFLFFSSFYFQLYFAHLILLNITHIFTFNIRLGSLFTIQRCEILLLLLFYI